MTGTEKSGKKKKRLFRRVKAHPEQAGFFRRALAFGMDTATVVLLTAVVYVGYSEIRGALGGEAGVITQFIQADKSGRPVSITLGGGEDLVENNTRALYLEALEEILDDQAYQTAEEMSLEELEHTYKSMLAEKNKAPLVITGGETFDLIHEFVVGYIFFILFFRFRGRTPGKWIMRLKVIDLHGREHLEWYQAFERTHGYAASALCALLGFFQVLWDKEGLTMHDKIAGTTVVRLPKKKRFIKWRGSKKSASIEKNTSREDSYETD